MSAVKKVAPKDPKAPKPGKEVVYVDHDDEITSIIDKVEAAKQKIVALVLPKRFTTLQSVVNMRLLKRSADTAGKNIVLITSEEALLPLAGAAGLHVAKNLQTKPEVPPSPITDKEMPELAAADHDAEIDDKQAKLDYHRSVGELATTHSADEPDDAIALGGTEDTEPVAAAKAAPKNKRLKIPNFDRFRLLLLLGGVGLVGLIIFLVFALTILPKATITVATTSTPVSADFSLTASEATKALDEPKKLIPASLKKSDQIATQQVQATGQKNLGEKATGQVKLANCNKNSTSSVTIPAGTGVSSAGLVFITQKSTTLESANFDGSGNCKTSGSHISDVNVTAQSPGTKYNIGPSSFSVSGFSGVSGSTSSAMSGGTDNNVTTLTQQDIDGAKQKITAADSDNFSKAFQKKLSDEGNYVITSTLKLSEAQITSSVPVGQETDKATVTVKITYSVLTLPKSDLEKVIKSNLNSQIDPKKQKLSDDNSLDRLTVTITNQPSPSSANLNFSKDATAVPIINIEEVKKQVMGKKDSQIKTLLGDIPGVKSVETKFSPFWVSKVPKKTGRIEIKLTKVEPSKDDSGN